MVDSAYFKTLLPGTQSKFGEGKADPLQSDLLQQAAILERATIVVCHDSAPMHIAAALGRPTCQQPG